VQGYSRARRGFRKVVIVLPGVRVREGESFEGALRRFKKSCEKAGILSEIRRRQVYEKPSIQRKKKEAAARKRLLKRIRRMGSPAPRR